MRMASYGAILISDKRAKLKPCLRCGYSLLHIAGARNCPECGLAIRISLSGNRGLEWSNPRWQRFLALACCVLVLGLFCRILGWAADWLIYGADEDYYELESTIYWALWRLSTVTAETHLIICGLAFCLLTKGEKRYPDESRAVRAVVLSGGVLVFALGLVNAFMEPGVWISLTPWQRYLLSRVLYGPWIPVTMSVFGSAFALSMAKRASSRLLTRLSQLPGWPSAAGILVWLFDLGRIAPPLPSLIWDWLLPISMIVMLVPTIRTLLRCATQADANWVADP